MSFFVYIIRCADGSYYTGHTDDLEARIAAHHEGAIPGYTRSRRPVAFQFSQEFAAREEALARESQIKRWTRRKKEALIRGDSEGLQAFSPVRGSTSSPRTGG